jgi:hypothetical protein
MIEYKKLKKGQNMQKLILPLIFFTTALFAYSSPSHVELNIYKNSSFMTKTFDIQGKNDISLSLPSQIQLEQIKIKSNRCDKNSARLSLAKTQANEKIIDLKNKILTLSVLMQSANEKNNILTTISLKDKDTVEMKQILSFFDKQFLKNSKKISTLKEELAKANKELKKLQSGQRNKYKEFEISLTCKSKGQVKITYPQFGFEVNNFYEFRANTLKKQLTFTKKIEIKQKSGFDFDKLDIYAHSNAYNQKVAPYPFYPKYLRQQREKMLKSMAVSFDGVRQAKNMVTFRRNFSTSSFVLRNVSLKNNQTKIFALEKKTININFSNDIDGYASTLAYLKTKIKSDKVYQRAISYIYLDDNEVGKIMTPYIKRGDFWSIYFGENQNIKVKKTLLKRFNESEFFTNNKKNRQIWLYKIKNSSNIAQKINLIERLPISQDESIEVKPMFDTKNAKISKNGKVIWNFTLQPNEEKNIKYGYTVTK